MSALASAKGEGLEHAIVEAARPIFARAIWRWFAENRDHVILKKWGFISVTVGMLRPLIEMIAGPEPTTEPNA